MSSISFTCSLHSSSKASSFLNSYLQSVITTFASCELFPKETSTVDLYSGLISKDKLLSHNDCTYAMHLRQ